MSGARTESQILDLREYRQHHFERAVSRPDEEVAAAEEAARVTAILEELSAEDHALLQRHFTVEAVEMMALMRHRTLNLSESIVRFCCFPFAWPKVWGVIYALDLATHDGRNMDETARMLGCKRATISIHARNFLEINNLPPSRWMRAEKSAGRSKQAREKQLTPRP
jgi:hypothetical protein